jgi:hypothetical protein
MSQNERMTSPHLHCVIPVRRRAVGKMAKFPKKAGAKFSFFQLPKKM